jgi:hypothetical protein
MKHIFLIVFSLAFLGCEAVGDLFHGEKPQPPAVTYTVAFYGNGASGNPPAERIVRHGEVISLPNIGGMAYYGFNFFGWSESATIGVGAAYFVGDSITVT